jgi:hypothetical protein
MADITVTAGSVVATAGSSIQRVKFGATIVQGKSVYLDITDSEWKVANCETSLVTAGKDGIGVALTSGADGQWGVIWLGGSTINLGATLVVGTAYYVSTSGGIMPAADLISNDYVTLLGIATTTALLKPSINITGVQVP